MKSLRRPHLLPALILVAGGACTDVIGPSPLYVTITEIEIASEDDSGTLLEVEVHLFDAYSGLFLGCSGQDDGLEWVDEPGVVYYPDASFVRPPRGGLLTVSDLAGRDVYAVVVEDDDEPCPVPTNEGSFDLVTDDLIGESPVFRGEDLDIGVAFGFGNVVWLELVGTR